MTIARKEQGPRVKNTDNRTETGQSSPHPSGIQVRHASKTHKDYWAPRLKKRSYIWKGKRIEIADWHVRLFFSGREGWFNLETPNKAAAASKAGEIYTFLRANGWEATVAKFKAKSDTKSKSEVTVGNYLNAVKEAGLLRPRTFLNYQNCFRTIVAGAFNIKDSTSKFDYRSGGNQKWVDRIDGVRLEQLTADKIKSWQRRFISESGNSPVAIASTKRTSNSYIRCARSLFSSRIRQIVKGLELPASLPFDGVELSDSGSMKYMSKINVRALIASAKTELKNADPEVYKAFLLALFAGMRRGEIDLCEWGMFDWDCCVIKLEQTEWLRLKTEDSSGVISLDPEVMQELKSLMPVQVSSFVLDSSRQPRNDSARPYYRCEPIFDRLNEWLRSKGITANKPLHEMRKEIGAQIATQHGIYAASRFLRHSDITTTARHYAEHKGLISVGLGKLLMGDQTPSLKTSGLAN